MHGDRASKGPCGCVSLRYQSFCNQAATILAGFSVVGRALVLLLIEPCLLQMRGWRWGPEQPHLAALLESAVGQTGPWGYLAPSVFKFC